jgi:hypothetical protein
MLRGKYRINPACPEAWSKLVAICRSLAAEGAEYTAAILPNGWVAVTAQGGKPPKRKRPGKPRVIPAPVSDGRIQKQAEQAKRAAIRPGLLRPDKPRWARYSDYGYQLRTKQDDRRIGRIVARAIARGEHAISAETLHAGDQWYHVFGPQSVQSVIKGRQQTKYDHNTHEPSVEDRKAALAEYQYWRELEALSGQRERWKPGLTDETMYADDEVAA